MASVINTIVPCTELVISTVAALVFFGKTYITVMKTYSNASPRQHPLMLLFCGVLLISSVQPAFAHGTVTYPPSRVWNCYKENPENPESAACIAAVVSHGTQPLYDWNEINQGMANGEHQQAVPDGNLASGGRPEKYGGMDQVRADWKATAVTPGELMVTWSNTAPHATDYYDVYITTEDWTPDQPLTWDKLTLLVRTAPSPADPEVNIPVILPERTGKHVIYSVWQRSDSPEAFYSTSDVDFGAGTTGVEDAEHSSFRFTLNRIFPNPFQATSKITYSLQESAAVSLRVYDVCGKEVAALVNDVQPSGDYEMMFDGEHLNSGIYLCVLRAGNHVVTKRMVLQK
jgi:predicted carbohydrate-binding protein with CBM5 and CBM33 domain